MIAMEEDAMAHTQISDEPSAWLLQAKDFLDEARRLKPGAERNELREVAKVLRELAKLEALSESLDESRETLSAYRNRPFPKAR
jgi:hypothetical protein